MYIYLFSWIGQSCAYQSPGKVGRELWWLEARQIPLILVPKAQEISRFNCEIGHNAEPNTEEAPALIAAAAPSYNIRNLDTHLPHGQGNSKVVCFLPIIRSYSIFVLQLILSIKRHLMTCEIDAKMTSFDASNGRLHQWLWTSSRLLIAHRTIVLSLFFIHPASNLVGVTVQYFLIFHQSDVLHRTWSSLCGVSPQPWRSDFVLFSASSSSN